MSRTVKIMRQLLHQRLDWRQCLNEDHRSKVALSKHQNEAWSNLLHLNFHLSYSDFKYFHNVWDVNSRDVFWVFVSAPSKEYIWICSTFNQFQFHFAFQMWFPIESHLDRVNRISEPLVILGPWTDSRWARTTKVLIFKFVWIFFQLTNIRAIFRNILNVSIDEKFIFTIKNPFVVLNFFNDWKIPRFFVFRMMPNENYSVSFFWCPLLQFCRFFNC